MSEENLYRPGGSSSRKQGSLFPASVRPLDPMPADAITITGSRDVPRDVARPLFDRHLKRLCDEPRIWFLGGAKGVDHWATEWLLEQQQVCWIVVPFTLQEQPKQARSLFDMVAKTIELELPHSKGAYIIRNRYMVDHSRMVIGFWSGNRGGTISTLRYALDSGREVHAIPTNTPNVGELTP